LLLETAELAPQHLLQCAPQPIISSPADIATRPKASPWEIVSHLGKPPLTIFTGFDAKIRQDPPALNRTAKVKQTFYLLDQVRQQADFVQTIDMFTRLNSEKVQNCAV